MAWIQYDEENPILPEEMTDLFDCSVWSPDRPYFAGDVVCEKYVWKCRDFSRADFCNLYQPINKFGYIAWELLPFHPNQVQYVDHEYHEVPEEEFDPNFEPVVPQEVEPTHEELLSLINSIPLEAGYEMLFDPIVLPLGLHDMYENFYKDHAEYGYESNIIDRGESVITSTEWGTPIRDSCGDECLIAFGHPVLF